MGFKPTTFAILEVSSVLPTRFHFFFKEYRTSWCKQLTTQKELNEVINAKKTINGLICFDPSRVFLTLAFEKDSARVEISDRQLFLFLSKKYNAGF